MTTGGVAQRIIRFSIACVGHLPGGLAIAGVFACMLFAALSGSSPATVVAIGTIVIGGMRQVGYTKDFAAGVICKQGHWVSYPTVYRDGRLCSFGGGFGWADVSGWGHPGAFSRFHADDRPSMSWQE